MAEDKNLVIVHNKEIQSMIYTFRGRQVMIDRDLAYLYNVETKALNQAVKRNINRFPESFRFQISDDEKDELVTNCDQLPETLKHSSVAPMAFTEQGVAMLSSVLRSPTAIEVNIAIMRTFVAMRRMIAGYEELKKRIEDFEVSCNMQFSELYTALTELLEQKEKAEKPRNPVGFIIPKQEK